MARHSNAFQYSGIDDNGDEIKMNFAETEQFVFSSDQQASVTYHRKVQSLQIVRKYTKKINELMHEFRKQTLINTKKSRLECFAIVDTIKEVQAAQRVYSSNGENPFGLKTATLIDTIFDEFSSKNENQHIINSYEKDVQFFLNTYFTLKRERRLKTQEQVAIESGIDRRYISELERGRRKPQKKTLEKLAKCFGVGVEVFVRKPCASYKF